jgi:hypothetical protein
MSTPAGWYPQPDGQQRYWDGQQWTEHLAPGIPAETTSLPPLKMKTEQATGSDGRSFSLATWFGWGGLALAFLIGALSGGFSGAVIMLGLFALVVGVIALARGRVSWARLGSRAAGGVAIGAAFALLTVGAIAAPSTSPPGGSATTSSETPTVADAAAEAAAQAADKAAAELAAANQAATDQAAAEVAAADKVAADKAAADRAAADKATAAAAAKKASAPELGKTVRDGKFAFTVTAIKCGIAQVGSDFLTQKAQGQYCRTSLTVENIGDEAQTMYAGNQYLFDTKGRKFSADATANIYDDSAKLMFEEINPGNSIKGFVYFDVPKGTKVTKLELHDSMFSGGIEVRL